MGVLLCNNDTIQLLFSKKDGRLSVLSEGYGATLMNVPQLRLKKKSGGGRVYDTSLGGDVKPLVLGDLVLNTWHTQLL